MLWHDHDIDFARWLHPAMWYVALGSWHWICQVAAPCNVACGSGIMTVNSPSGRPTWKVKRGSGMTCHWIPQVAAPCNVTRGSGMTCHRIRPVAAPCKVTRSSGIMTLNSPGGSTLQCGRWPWHDTPLNSPRRPPYWNSTSGFDFDHITAVDMTFCTSLRNFIQIGPPSAQKNSHVDYSRWRISAILDFMGPIIGSLKSPCTTSYSSSIETIALRKSLFLHFDDRQTNRQTNRKTNRWTSH